jgi:hypothetical protein
MPHLPKRWTQASRHGRQAVASACVHADTTVPHQRHANRDPSVVERSTSPLLGCRLHGCRTSSGRRHRRSDSGDGSVLAAIIRGRHVELQLLAGALAHPTLHRERDRSHVAAHAQCVTIRRCQS